MPKATYCGHEPPLVRSLFALKLLHTATWNQTPYGGETQHWRQIAQNAGPNSVCEFSLQVCDARRRSVEKGGWRGGGRQRPSRMRTTCWRAPSRMGASPPAAAHVCWRSWRSASSSSPCAGGRNRLRRGEEKSSGICRRASIWFASVSAESVLKEAIILFYPLPDPRISRNTSCFTAFISDLFWTTPSGQQ